MTKVRRRLNPSHPCPEPPCSSDFFCDLKDKLTSNMLVFTAFYPRCPGAGLSGTLHMPVAHEWGDPGA